MENLNTKQKRLAIVAVVLVVLMLTNPSMRQFKEYRGVSSYRGMQRTFNFLIGSVYQVYGNHYVGILGNFININ